MAADLATVVAHLTAHPARVTVTGPGGQPRTVTIDLVSFLSNVVDGYLASAQTAVLPPADLQAFARGAWAKVIEVRGLTSATSSAAAPAQLQQITIGCSDAWAALDPRK